MADCWLVCVFCLWESISKVWADRMRFLWPRVRDPIYFCDQGMILIWWWMGVDFWLQETQNGRRSDGGHVGRDGWGGCGEADQRMGDEGEENRKYLGMLGVTALGIRISRLAWWGFKTCILFRWLSNWLAIDWKSRWLRQKSKAKIFSKMTKVRMTPF